MLFHGRRQDARRARGGRRGGQAPARSSAVPAPSSTTSTIWPPRNVRVCLQGHPPIMAAINAVHATMKALREGKPGWEFENISPPSELMKRATRQADYAAWSSDFLKAGG